MNGGRGSNTKAELIALWCICTIATRFGIDAFRFMVTLWLW